MPKSILRAVLGRIQFTLHATRRTPHGAARLVRAMSAWLVKTRRAPSRHSRDARVYCHMTTTMQKLSTPPHSPRPPFSREKHACIPPLERQERYRRRQQEKAARRNGDGDANGDDLVLRKDPFESAQELALSLRVEVETLRLAEEMEGKNGAKSWAIREVQDEVGPAF